MYNPYQIDDPNFLSDILQNGHPSQKHFASQHGLSRVKAWSRTYEIVNNGILIAMVWMLLLSQATLLRAYDEKAARYSCKMPFPVHCMRFALAECL